MKIAYDILEVRTEIGRIKQRGDEFLTNFFFDSTKLKKLIDSSELSYKVIGNTLFLFKKNENFVSLYFCSTRLESLVNDFLELNHEFEEALFVLDVVGYDDVVSNVVKSLLEVGLYEYTSLVRMSGNVISKGKAQDINSVFYASIERINYIYSLLNQYFDKYAEQIPSLKELKELALNNNILVYLENNNLQGFLIFEIKGYTSHLRYWFVMPECRENRVGSLLFRKYLYECRQTKRQLFWVIEANENAIVRYEYYGFKKENMVTQILTNRDINYGKKSS